MLWLVIVIVNICFGFSQTTSGCDPELNRCPCLRYTYKMATYKNKCFQFYYGSKTWKEARDYCAQQGGRLIMINDPDTFNFIRSTLSSLSWNAADLWIGAHDMQSELKWVWTNYRGEPDVPMTWSFWAPEHPGGWFHSYKDCIVMKKDRGQWKWHEAMCHTFPFEYKFICEYEMLPGKPGDPDFNAANGVGGIYQQFDSSLQGSASGFTTPGVTSTVIRYKNGQEGLTKGEHRLLVNGDQNKTKFDLHIQGAMATSTDNSDHHVPIYVVVIAFISGTACTLAIVLFIIFRRRKRRKARDSLYPGVEYHAHSGRDDQTPSNTVVVAGAAGGAPVCTTTGKLCKVALDVGAEACACAEQPTVHVHDPAKRKAPPNIYVSVRELHHTSATQDAAQSHTADRVRRSASEGHLAAQRVDSPSDASIGSSANNLDEAPPTYDEACASMLTEQAAVQRSEVPYANNKTNTPTSENQPSIVAMPSKTADSIYLPMDGSNKSSPASSIQSSQSSLRSAVAGATEKMVENVDKAKDMSQYLPMSLGGLPPVPTDDGYEIPVTRTLQPEAVRQINQSDIYSEIPDTAAQAAYPEDEQIYSTID